LTSIQITHGALVMMPLTQRTEIGCIEPTGRIITDGDDVIDHFSGDDDPFSHAHGAQWVGSTKRLAELTPCRVIVAGMLGGSLLIELLAGLMA
jgi:hypothetical protein